MCITLLSEFYISLLFFFLKRLGRKNRFFLRAIETEWSRGRFTSRLRRRYNTVWPTDIYIHTKKRIIPFVRAQRVREERKRELSPRGEAGARLPAYSTSFRTMCALLASRYEGEGYSSPGRWHCWPTMPHGASHMALFLCTFYRVFLYTPSVDEIR